MSACSTGCCLRGTDYKENCRLLQVLRYQNRTSRFINALLIIERVHTKNIHAQLLFLFNLTENSDIINASLHFKGNGSDLTVKPLALGNVQFS